MVQWYTKSSFQRIDVEYIGIHSTYTMEVPLCVCFNIISCMILTKRTGKIGEEEGKG